MLWLLDTVGGSVKTRKRSNVRHRAYHDWKVFGNNARDFLRAIRPFMIIKAQQADVVLAFYEFKERVGRQSPLSPEVVGGRDTFRIELMRLNKKGA